ncbi:hypothetical protein NEIMUCOT_03595 [Neisseria mucosa ATCC 25996]|uniref:Uncharacterized protein n=1 Tax=Neisseria mucosa (strain ATCC 25996 / DSM 4631 / NCTC 10774 / M26) TaxID=546266 RepID=D2ZSL2_NEIM2|nr:hypothetical protein NEIMUCOT_03595 [Neisseria mucosa ATCC 25996]
MIPRKVVSTSGNSGIFFILKLIQSISTFSDDLRFYRRQSSLTICIHSALQEESSKFKAK